MSRLLIFRSVSGCCQSSKLAFTLVAANGYSEYLSSPNFSLLILLSQSLWMGFLLARASRSALAFFFFWSHHHLQTCDCESPVRSDISTIFSLDQLGSSSNSCLRTLIWAVLFLFRFLVPSSEEDSSSISSSDSSSEGHSWQSDGQLSIGSSSMVSQRSAEVGSVSSCEKRSRVAGRGEVRSSRVRVRWWGLRWEGACGKGERRESSRRCCGVRFWGVMGQNMLAKLVGFKFLQQRIYSNIKQGMRMGSIMGQKACTDFFMRNVRKVAHQSQIKMENAFSCLFFLLQ